MCNVLIAGNVFFADQGIGTDEQILIEILSSRSYEVSVEFF